MRVLPPDLKFTAVRVKEPDPAKHEKNDPTIFDTP